MQSLRPVRRVAELGSLSALGEANPTMKRSLFYPCCGRDVRESVRSWLHMADDFWFGEITYTHERKLKSGETDISWRIPNVSLPQLQLLSENDSFLAGDNDHSSPVKTFTYLHTTWNKTITFNFVGGCAVAAFHRLPFEKIAIFVNRGDHRVNGEGSSGICWLANNGTGAFPDGLLKDVLAKLDIGGLIVSDGSNADESLAPYWDQRDVPRDIHLNAKPITLHGRKMRCIGMLEPKYGPTLIWQVFE
ncbi:MAG: hypothetical protein R3C01_17520 [Planctomycetaceae bacterium]